MEQKQNSCFSSSIPSSFEYLKKAIINIWIIDWAHFTRKGYNAKAYVIAKMIENRLTNVTNY